MSNLIKAIISFIILVLLAISISFVLFYSKIDLGFIKFINTHLEQKYQKEIDKTGQSIEKYLKEINTEINSYITKFDFSKFIDKLKSKNFNLVNEDNISKELVTKYNSLYCIKFFDNNKNLLFSTLDKERVVIRGLISFVSFDRIENIKNIYALEKSNKTQFIFFDEYIILKKMVSYNNKIIGVILFYFKNSLFLDILLQNEFLKYESLTFINDSLIFLNKPKEIPDEELEKMTIDEKNTKVIQTNIKDSSGKNISKIYKSFKYVFKNFDITLLKLVDNEVFLLDKRRSTILVFLFFLTLYILILLILSFKRSDFDKAKEKVSLFSAMLLEEIINSRTRDEIEKLKSQLGQRKKKILDNIYTDFKKLNKSNKKSLEEQLDIILKKIEETMNKNLETLQQTETIQKMEQLFERLISTITEKGIAFNYNPKLVNKVKEVEYIESKNIKKGEPVEVEEVTDAEEVEEIEEIEEVESVEELEEVEEVENTNKGKPIEVEEVTEVEEVEEIEEVEPVEEIEEVEEVKEVEEVNKGKPIEVEEIEEVGDVENIEEVKDIEEIEEIKEREPVEEISEIEKSNNILPELIDNPEEFDMSIFSGENNLVLKKEPLFRYNRDDSDDIVIYEIFNEQEENNLPLETNREESENGEINLDSFPEIIYDENINIKKTISESEKEERKKDDINIEDLFNINKEDLKEYNEENVEEIEAVEEEIPKIPDSFYENLKKPEDDLAKYIEEIERHKTPFQNLLDNICKDIDALKLSLFINITNSKSFIQSYQNGFKESRVEQYNIDTNNILVQHIFTNERVVYVADMNKIKSIFQNNEKIYEDYQDMKSLLIYPVKIFGKIRALIFFGFIENKKESLEVIIEILEKNKEEIVRNILKLI